MQIKATKREKAKTQKKTNVLEFPEVPVKGNSYNGYWTKTAQAEK